MQGNHTHFTFIAVFEWIPYDRFNDIKIISKNLYSAVWKDGPLYCRYDESHKDIFKREPTRNVALLRLDSSQNITDESLRNKFNRYSRYRKYGISQNPETKDYVMVIQNGLFCECNDGYTAMWNDGPLYFNYYEREYTRESYRSVALKCLHDSQKTIDEILNEVKLIIDDKISPIYGISQSPDTKDYILVFNYDWYYKNHCVSCAKWKDGPLNYGYGYIRSSDDDPLNYRESDKNVTLKCLYKNENITDEFLNEVKKYSINRPSDIRNIYGISQNPDTKHYILVLQFDYFEEYCVKCNKRYSDTRFSWCRTCQTIYSAKWKDGPLFYSFSKMEYIRYTNKTIALKCLYGSQNITDVLHEVKKYSINRSNDILNIYGITQNPDTKDYILVLHFEDFEKYCTKCNKIYTDTRFNWCRSCQISFLEQNFVNWTSENKKIDKFIQEVQSKINDYGDIILEWIPYNQFNNIKEIDKNDFNKTNSAIWMDGPLFYNYQNKKWARVLEKEVTLICFYNNSSDIINELLNEAEKYSIKKFRDTVGIYGISQNPDTKDYILVLQNGYCTKCGEKYTDIRNNWCKSCQLNNLFTTNWTSVNEKVGEFIQKMQSKINKPTDIIFEWIPYNKFNDIKEISKDGFTTEYLAIWMDGPLNYNCDRKEYERNSADKKVALKYAGISQNITDNFLNKAIKEYTINNDEDSLKIYGISQHPNTNNYILVLHERYFKKNFEEYYLYSAIWKDGPLYYDWNKYSRESNQRVALKCLNNSQNITDEFLNEVQNYSTEKYSNNILKIYGITQNPDTKDYIMVLEYADGGNFCDYWINNGNHKNFNWHDKIRTLNNIIKGLKEIHQKQMVHCDFHTGNILFTILRKKTYISDMGLCREVSNMNKAKIYGVMPYVAPEVLRGKSYTQAADVYSFGMIMYVTATGRQPFANRAHDEVLALDICNKIRPKIQEPEAPKCYIDLMKRCWDSNPDKRPDVTEVHDQISSWNQYINNDLFKQAEEYRKANLPFFIVDQTTTHPQAIYTSRILNSFTDDLKYDDNDDDDNSKCLDYAIND
ncbi:kinase-like domain-containing protein [Rhizophagus clarus]|uniref:Kinase-like domain-containing protein n=1 Tax=Rhizophagus clarus TaxID=94130 RepID=A0A8H3MB15_9GLOM|nr:kinase-like domain-containing protein [Rhizophagus clarus]